MPSLLKVKRRRVAVPYLRLWEELLVETRARSLFQRLKRLYSLLLQLLILLSILLALGQPAFELSSVKRESIVVLLDTKTLLTLEQHARNLFHPENHPLPTAAALAAAVAMMY